MAIESLTPELARRQGVRLSLPGVPARFESPRWRWHVITESLATVAGAQFYRE
jgi:hypothetical protein